MYRLKMKSLLMRTVLTTSLVLCIGGLVSNFAYMMGLPSSLPLAIHAACAQDDDPIVTVQNYISAGKKEVKTASSRRLRSRRHTKKRVGIFFKALKSFSSALRTLDEYEMEEEAPELYQEITSLMDQVMKRKDVKKKLDQVEGNLVKAMKTGAYEDARQLAQELVDLNEHNKEVKYLLPILNDLLSGDL